MKHVVVTTGLHEADIRPTGLLDEFRKLSEKDARTYFGDPSRLVDVACPACECPDKELAFRKAAFSYHQCPACKSVFVSPRPTEEALEDYYANSEASRYRVEHFARTTGKARRFHLLGAHADWIAQLVDDIGNRTLRTCTDVGTTSPEVFDEISRLNLFDSLNSFRPLPVLRDELAAKGVRVFDEPVPNQGAITAIGQLEHLFSPVASAVLAHDMLGEGGLLFLTSRTVSGFDLQVLWDKAPYVFVPEHLNLLSIDGFRRLVERSGLELIELSTPGQLDVELTRNAMQHDPTIQPPPFIRYLLNHRGPDAHADFQAFLQKHRLSSHVRVAARKPTAAQAADSGHS